MQNGTQDDDSNNSSHYFCYSLIQTTPAVKDPRELHTIITNSLRFMFGDCHSYSFDVIDCYPSSSKDEDRRTASYFAILKTPIPSFRYVRACLCFVQPPTHLQDNIYRFDFIITHSSLNDFDRSLMSSR